MDLYYAYPNGCASRDYRRAGVELVAQGLAVRELDGPEGLPRFQATAAGVAEAVRTLRATKLSPKMESLLVELAAGYPKPHFVSGGGRHRTLWALERAGMAVFVGFAKKKGLWARATRDGLERVCVEGSQA